LALQIRDGKKTDIWVYEWERDTLTRLTFSGESNQNPVWTPDGQRITYSSAEKGGVYGVYWKRADGAGDAVRLTESRNQQVPNSWRPHGKLLALMELNASTSWDIFTLSVEGDDKSGWKTGEPKPFLNSSFSELASAFSPDGRWLVYHSNESGNFEVYAKSRPPARTEAVCISRLRLRRLTPDKR